MFLLTSIGTYTFIYFLFGLEDLLDYILFEQQVRIITCLALEGFIQWFYSQNTTVRISNWKG